MQINQTHISIFLRNSKQDKYVYGYITTYPILLDKMDLLSLYIGKWHEEIWPILKTKNHKRIGRERLCLITTINYESRP